MGARIPAAAAAAAALLGMPWWGSVTSLHDDDGDGKVRLATRLRHCDVSRSRWSWRWTSDDTRRRTAVNVTGWQTYDFRQVTLYFFFIWNLETKYNAKAM